jgi:hypothetical protein
LLALQPKAAWACSIAPDPRPVQEQIDESLRESWLRSEALLEVVAVEGSRRHHPGLVRVVRVLKGRIRRGQILSLRSVDSGLCGAGDFERGSRGLILLYSLRWPLVFNGYLRPDYLRELDRLGVRPLNAPVPRR